MSKQTAVEWLELQLLNLVSFNTVEVREEYRRKFEQAKQMEKEQIMKAYDKVSMSKPEEYYDEIIGKFMNWFLKHYSTATKDGFFVYVNSLEEEVTMREILDDYFKNK